jgi:hypothetical protein
VKMVLQDFAIHFRLVVVPDLRSDRRKVLRKGSSAFGKI